MQTTPNTLRHGPRPYLETVAVETARLIREGESFPFAAGVAAGIVPAPPHLIDDLSRGERNEIANYLSGQHIPAPIRPIS